MAEQLDEMLDARIPESLVAAQPLIGPLERPRIDATVVNSSAHRAFDEAGSLECLDVLRCGGERHAVRRRQLTYCLLASGEPAEHGAPGMVAKGAEDEIETGLMMFNHMVERASARSDCQLFG